MFQGQLICNREGKSISLQVLVHMDAFTSCQQIFAVLRIILMCGGSQQDRQKLPNLERPH